MTLQINSFKLCESESGLDFIPVFTRKAFCYSLIFLALNSHILYKLKIAVLDIDNLDKGTTGDKGNVYHLTLFNLWRR